MLAQQVEDYKTALKNQDNAVLLKTKECLLENVAWALMEQDNASLKYLRGICANLAPLADHFDNTSKNGDSWRTLNNLLRLFNENVKPLEQLRLAFPNTISGKILRIIKSNAGITQPQVAKLLNIESPQITEVVVQLSDANLIVMLKRDKEYEFYLSNIGKNILEDLTPNND